jgi:hypothetical protein
VPIPPYTLTVSDLISLLSLFPPSLRVVIYDPDFGFTSITSASPTTRESFQIRRIDYEDDLILSDASLLPGEEALVIFA